jgi:hypothetical protein
MGEEFNDKTTSQNGGIFHATTGVISDWFSGIKDEVIHRPWDLLNDGLYGAAITVGTAAMAPEAGLLVAGVGIGLAAKGIYDHAGEWFNASLVLDDADHHSQSEIDAAHETFKGLGRGSAELAAGALGGAVGLRAVASISTNVETINEPRPQTPPPKELKIALDEPKSDGDFRDKGLDAGTVVAKPPFPPPLRELKVALEEPKGIRNFSDKGLNDGVFVPKPPFSPPLKELKIARQEPESKNVSGAASGLIPDPTRPFFPGSLNPAGTVPRIIDGEVVWPRVRVDGSPELTSLFESAFRWKPLDELAEEARAAVRKRMGAGYLPEKPVGALLTGNFTPISALERDLMISKKLIPGPDEKGNPNLNSG